jgi:hypothetical protein
MAPAAAFTMACVLLVYVYPANDTDEAVNMINTGRNQVYTIVYPGS